MRTLRKVREHMMGRLFRARDEARVRAHLGKLDAQDGIDKVDGWVRDTERRVSNVGDASRRTYRNVRTALRLVMEEVRAGWAAVRRAV